jgi:hypothetical protein
MIFYSLLIQVRPKNILSMGDFIATFHDYHGTLLKTYEERSRDVGEDAQ